MFISCWITVVRAKLDKIKNLVKSSKILDEATTIHPEAKT